MDKKIALTAAIFGGLAVGLGAFGAHGLERMLMENGRTDTYETAVLYHMFHTILLLFLAGTKIERRRVIAWLASIGILVFSGSLYLLSITNISILGAITPIGGVLFLLSWIMLAWMALKK